MSQLASILENFEAGNHGGAGDVRSQQLKAGAYAEGFAAGEAAIAAKQEEEQAFQFAAAAEVRRMIDALPQQLNEQLAEATAAIMHKVLPSLAAKGFASEAAAAIVDNVIADKCGEVVVKTSADRLDDVKAAFAGADEGLSLRVEADPGMTGSVIAATWKNGGLEMDIDAAASKVLGILDQYLSQFKEEN